MKIGKIIGIAKLYSTDKDMFIVSCGDCGMIFHLQTIKYKVQCPICHKEIEIIK